MDALERLTADDLNEPTLIVSHHLHRYHLAATLCRGLRVLDLGCGVGYGSRIIREAGATAVRGVDSDPVAIREAEDRYATGAITFAVEDAVRALRRADPGAVDAVVAFEVLEHLEHFDEAMDLLRELSRHGVRLALSVPNSRAFAERNEFHRIDFDYDSALAAFETLNGVHMLFQHIAEGSVLLGAGAELRGRVEHQHHGEPEYANTFIALAGFDDADVSNAAAQLNVVATPNHNRYMLGLQRGNEELVEVNRRLSRSWLGKSDAAAAAVLARVAEAERDFHARAGDLVRRIDELTAEVLQVGDERADLQRRLNQLETKKLIRAARWLDSMRPSQRK